MTAHEFGVTTVEVKTITCLCHPMLELSAKHRDIVWQTGKRKQAGIVISR